MKRMTRRKDEYECRMADCCPAEDWMKDYTGHWPENGFCNTCPFMEYINKLAEYEDVMEKLEDYLK